MGYTSGHYRKGHYRNGKWVSGSYVKGHYSSGPIYRYGLSSIDTSTTDARPDESCDSNMEQQNGTNKDVMEEVNQRLSRDYEDNEFPYARTLRFFDAYYPYDVEDVHYDDVMLSMNECVTIDELISVRERLKEKVKNTFHYEDLSKDIIRELLKSASVYANYQSEYSRIQDNLRADINVCYDENVFRLFKESETITANSCGECFVNLSYCWEGSTYKELIIREAKERANIDVSELLETIAKRHKEFEKHWNEYKKFKEGMNGYNAAKKVWNISNDLTGDCCLGRSPYTAK